MRTAPHAAPSFRRNFLHLFCAGALLISSLIAVTLSTAHASPQPGGGYGHANPSSWNPTDHREPFDVVGPYKLDTRIPHARNTGIPPRTGFGSFHDACRRAINTWSPLEPMYLNWRIKVENTDDYIAAEPEASMLSYYLNLAYHSINQGLSGIPGYQSDADPLRAYVLNIHLMQEMINTGGGLSPALPEAGIPWERWDKAWESLSRSHDVVLKVCPIG